MKGLVFIAPIVALAVVGGWIASQRASIGALVSQTTVLRERIALARTGEDANPDRSLAGHRDRELEEGRVDWGALVEGMSPGPFGEGMDMRAMMKMQQQLAAMDAEQIQAALDEIAALEIDVQTRRMLEGMLIGFLARKEPEVALTRYVDRISDDQSGMSWQLANAFGTWAGKNPVAAAAWFDKEIAAGRFDSRSLDGKSTARTRFEAALMGNLLKTSPEGAAGRLAALPEDQRADLFSQSHLVSVKPGTEATFAKLVREGLPEGDQEEAFVAAGSNLVHRGGYERVEAFIRGIDATAEERLAIVGKAVSEKLQNQWGSGTEVTRESVAEMREWASTQVPGEEDGVTGRALGNVRGERGEYEKRVELVGELHDAGGGDALLLGFLEGGSALQHVEVARPLVAKIQDEAKRAEVEKRLEGHPKGRESAVEIQSTEVAE